MEKHKEIERELSEVAPLLAQLKSRQGNSPPVGYFEHLPAKVAAKAGAAHMRRRYLSLRAAAAAVILLLAGWWAAWPLDSPVGQITLSELGEEEASAYVTDQIEHFELSLLLDAGAGALSGTEEEGAYEDYLEEHLSPEDMDALF